MYYWKEKYENIWDSAPRPKYRGSSGGGNGTSGQCVCKDKSLREQLDKLMEAFSAITTEDVTSVASRYMKEDICCCTKNYCKHMDTNIPDSELDSDMWDLYTFFLNEFNTKDMDEACGGASDDSPGGTSSNSEPKTADDEELFDLFYDGPNKTDRYPRWDPLFKVKIMETMKDCMTHRDIHRFYLLQHTKLILHFFNVQHVFAQKNDSEHGLPPDG